jgi:uncharacterized membrane protein
MTRLLWIISEIASRLWYSASFYGVMAIATALAAIYLKQYVPEGLPQKIGADAVDGILNILAASMLSVTIFSLSTMVSAYSAATSNITPRATKLLIEDKISHRALSTFLGAFIFSIVGIVALKTGVYGDSGRLILFVVTIGVIAMIVITLFSWIEYLARLGRVGETIERVEDATTKALEKRLCMPYLGGTPLKDEKKIPKKAVAVEADITGYVQHIDMAHLSKIAEKHEAIIYVAALPGKFLDSALPVAFVTGIDDPDILSDIKSGFITGSERSFRQDPRFGLAVLHEIASRALSPALNDPGTAIQVIGVVVRILLLWAKREEKAGSDHEIHYPRVHVQALCIEDLFEDFFPPVSRDGAAILEVQLRLQKAYAALARSGDADLRRGAKYHSTLSFKRAENALVLAEDKKRLKQQLDAVLELLAQDRKN